jgi:myosin heavy subunit
MNSKWKLLLVMGGVVIALLVVWAFLTTIQVSSLRSDLTATRSELASVQSKLDTTESKLVATNNELAATKTTLTSTQTELNGTKTDLVITQNELTSTEKTLAQKTTELAATNTTLAATRSDLATTSAKLSDAQQNATALQTTLTQTQQQLAVSQNTLKGLGITINSSSQCTDVVLVDNPTATDPTFAQLTTFLAKDTTENHPYILNVYDCSQFSRDVHNNAEATGIRSAEVQVWFTNSFTGHALNAFLTTDYGLVYVDCTEAPDRFARVLKQTPYRSLETQTVPASQIRNNSWWNSLNSYYYIRSDFGAPAIISTITIYW